jgi:hypothetical protein
MVLAVRILAGLLLIWIFIVVVGRKAVPLEGGTTCNRAGNPLVPTSGLLCNPEWPISAVPGCWPGFRARWPSLIFAVARFGFEERTANECVPLSEHEV